MNPKNIKENSENKEVKDMKNTKHNKKNTNFGNNSKKKYPNRHSNYSNHNKNNVSRKENTRSKLKEREVREKIEEFQATQATNNINATAVSANNRPIYKPDSRYTPPAPVRENTDIPKDNTDTAEEKVEVVGVRYKPVGKIYFFSPGNVKYSVNDKVIVETSRGVELGYVVITNRKVNVSQIIQPLKQVQRRATEIDVEKVQSNKKLAKQAMVIADERVKAHGLKLKLIEAEYTFDNSKLLYYFTAENRIDFRELVKDLASIFKIRIELRQIGIRDQTKIVGGLSICGRPFCCNSFLQDFEQVTIKMAKEQNISINSAKISGACGRLMCCLRYEHETYETLCKDMPKVNAIVETSSGETGIVVEANALTGICKVKLDAKSSENALSVIKPYPKRELKAIGFVKGGAENNSSNNIF